MPTYDHTELLLLIRDLVDEHDEEYIAQCINQCHNGVLRGPINTGNLHLFRRYRNDPSAGDPDGFAMVARAKEEV